MSDSTDDVDWYDGDEEGDIEEDLYDLKQEVAFLKKELAILKRKLDRLENR